MFIFIDESLPDLVEEVREEVLKTRPNEKVVISGASLNYQPGTGLTHINRSTSWPAGSALERYHLLSLASHGVRLWHNTEDPLNPIYAGKPESAEKIVVDAAYSEMRAAYLNSFGVRYVGRSYAAPRTVILVDSDHPFLYPEEGSDVEKILRNLPVGSSERSPWSSFALASAPDLRKLRKFVDDHWDTNFLAYTTKDKNRLKKIGVEFGEIDKPVDTPAYGVHIRSVTALLRPYENSEIDFTIEVPEN